MVGLWWVCRGVCGGFVVGLWWVVVGCGGLWWFVVVCGGLWWFVVVCGGCGCGEESMKCAYVHVTIV